MTRIFVEWRGERWYFYDDYYKNRKGQLLHREFYIAARGPIPDDWDVHHKDWNKRNNALTNLEAMTRSDHLRVHPRKGFTVWTFEQRSQARLDEWARREPRAHICDYCGREYPSNGQRLRHCSGRCASAAWRANPDHYSMFECVICGKQYRTFTLDHGSTCSGKCTAALTKRLHPPKGPKRIPRDCVVCGGPVTADDPRTKACSTACGGVLRRKPRGPGK